MTKEKLPKEKITKKEMKALAAGLEQLLKKSTDPIIQGYSPTIYMTIASLKAGGRLHKNDLLVAALSINFSGAHLPKSHALYESQQTAWGKKLGVMAGDSEAVAAQKIMAAYDARYISLIED
jgi:hypothetical protein